MSSTITSSFAQQTADEGSQNQPTPPLLPAFLITGLLLVAIIAIIIWRHIIERRHLLQRGEDPTWPSDATGGSVSNRAKGPKPKLWEPRFTDASECATWTDIMPLSVVPLRGNATPRMPRYLLPSDPPITFLTRVFGGARSHPRQRLPRSPRRPSVQIPILQTHGSLEEDECAEPVDRLQVTVLIALPQRRCDRQASYLREKDNSLKDAIALPETEPQDPLASPAKGKKRSLEIAASVEKGDYDDDEEEGLLEVSFGTATLRVTGVEFGTTSLPCDSGSPFTGSL